MRDASEPDTGITPGTPANMDGPPNGDEPRTPPAATAAPPTPAPAPEAAAASAGPGATCRALASCQEDVGSCPGAAIGGGGGGAPGGGGAAGGAPGGGAPGGNTGGAPGALDCIGKPGVLS